MRATTCPASSVSPSSKRISAIRPGYFVETKTWLASRRPLPPANPSGNPGFEKYFQPNQPAVTTAPPNRNIARLLARRLFLRGGGGGGTCVFGDSGFGPSGGFGCSRGVETRVITSAIIPVSRQNAGRLGRTNLVGYRVQYRAWR